MTERRNRRRRQTRERRWILAGLFLALAAIALLIMVWPPKSEAHKAEPRTDRLPAGRSSGLPTGWERMNVSKQDLAAGTLVLVNREHGIDPAQVQTVSVYAHKTDSYLVKDTELSVRAEAMTALNRWMDDFAAESGRTDINVVSGWRSYDDQLWLYQNAVDTKGQAHADAYLALPGHSEHHTGLAVDLDTYNVADGTSGGFDGGGDYLWAVEHAWEYGFIQRYPPGKSEITGIDYEAWHFRYVGLPHAYFMAENDLCLEEYTELLRSYPFDGEHLTVTCPGACYEIYFCPTEQLVVPTDGAYTVSGNNADGFVVTIER